MTANEGDEFNELLRDVERLPRSVEPPRDLWPGIAGRLGTRGRRNRRALVWVPALAAAAALALVIVGRSRPGFTVTTLAGRPHVTAASVTTDDSSRAHIALSIGAIDVEAGTRLRVVAVRRHEQRFALEAGAISARVTAPPRVFIVETPSAVATDLGCAYTLRVDSAGNGLLHVTSGIVELGVPDRVVFVPLGAAAPTYAARGPGVPYVDDAPAALRRALARLDSAAGDSAALAAALAAARPEDGLSLWHVVSRVDPRLRGAVFDGLARLVPPPAGVTRAGVLQLDRRMLDEWWKYLPRTVWRRGL
jgi:hypothetical protein